LFCAIFSKNSEVHQFREFLAKRELERISSTDYLTNTANRFKIEEEAEIWIDFCRRQGLPLSLVFFDVDNLKKINDCYGHVTGDSILTNLVKLIKNQLRSSDVLARWGGDEFVILLPNASLENAATFTERIRNSIEQAALVKGISTTCSFGIAEMKDGSDFQSLICEADKLMYEGKENGKNNIQVATK